MISIYMFIIMLDFWLFATKQTNGPSGGRGRVRRRVRQTTAATLTVSNTARNPGNPFPFLFLAYQPVGTRCASQGI